MISDELKQGIKEALDFLNHNSYLFEGIWELRGHCIRNCNGECPIVFIAHKKGIKDGAKEDWWTVNDRINLNHTAGQLIANASDNVEDDGFNRLEIRDLLIDILQPDVNPKFGVYNEG